MNQRFTIDGSDALESHLAAVCQKVLDGVLSIVPSSRMEGLLLGGGYGRGEGGVLRTEKGDLPYNDLEFYVFLRGNSIFAERKHRPLLHHLGESLSSEAGLEVEFKVLTLDKLRRSSPSMFYYDLVEGHRWISGDDRLLAGCQHHRRADHIPLHEGARLLFNRCSGLLFAQERLKRVAFDAAEADFVGRNLAKAKLAFGDAILTALGKYHWSCRERHARLKSGTIFSGELAWAEPVKRFHAEGVEFKLHPRRSTASRETLASEHEALTCFGQRLWLWLEAKRLGAQFASAAEYALSQTDKCPETAAWRNRLINLRAFGLAGVAASRYPRERLFHALALLLWAPAALSDPNLLGRIQTELQTEARELPDLVQAYLKLWNRFN